MQDNKGHCAIVIGIDHYSMLPNVSAGFNSAGACATAFMEWLISRDGAALQPGSIYGLLSPPTPPANPADARPVQSDVDSTLSQLVDKRELIGGRLYFYFAGLASGSSLNDVQLMMANASLDHLAANLSLSHYRQFLTQSGLFDEIVFILDCTFLQSNPIGMPGRPELALTFEPRRSSVKEFILMSSANAREPDTPAGANFGLLTKAVLEGLRGAAASRFSEDITAEQNPEARITAVSLGDYVRARVRDLGTGPKILQLPEMLLPTEKIVFSTVSVSILWGTLVVQAPHWSAEIRISNSLLQLVAGPLALQRSPDNVDIYQAEVKLAEGIYKVDATLEGKLESQYVVVQINQTTTIRKDSWKELHFSSAAPLEGTATTHEYHMGPAIEWSKKVTWTTVPARTKGMSRLFLFVRTSDPKRYPRFAEGLRLLDANGERITDFSHGVKKDKRNGWLAFCADLKPGYYILRRGRSGIRLRQQPIYLCENWETQIFLEAESSPSLRTQSVNMARKGTGFQPNDETAIVAEAVLDCIRYGGNIKQLITKEKLSVLLHAKFENPWLGVLAAYVLRSQLDEQPDEQDNDTRNLLAHVMGFLNDIADHPDVRSLNLKMDQAASRPFTHPPLLIKGLKLVQQHSVAFPETVPEDSLTDLVLDSLVTNSPWTAWRHLEPAQVLAQGDESVKTGKHLHRFVTGRALNRATAVLQSSSPKAPVVRFDDVVSRASKKAVAAKAGAFQPSSLSVDFFKDASLLGVVQGLTQTSDLDNLPESVTLNEGKRASELLENLNSTDISQASGLSLAHTESTLQRLRDVASEKESATGGSTWDAELRPMDKVVLEYALAESGRPTEETPAGGVRQSPAITIEDCVTTIRGEASRLLLPPESEDPVSNSAGEAQAQIIGNRLIKAANSLLDRAAFTVTTDVRGNIRYCNRAFILLVTFAVGPLTEVECARKTKGNYKAWEKALKQISIGGGVLQNPIEGVGPKEFRVWRTAIREEQSAKPRAYLNTLKGKDAIAVTQTTLEQIAELLPDLARQASFFWYDLSERSEYAVKLEDITAKLELLIENPATATKPNQ